MRIVMVCDVLGAENNGTTVAAMNLIRSLQSKGHDLRFVCPDAFRAGEPGYYILPTVSLGPLNGYVRKNGVCLARGKKELLEQAIEGADLVYLLTPFLAAMKAAKLNPIEALRQ